MNFFQNIKARLRFREARRMTDAAHAANGERYYVMPMLPQKTKGGKRPRRRLLVIDRKNFRLMKRKGYISQQARVSDLEAECFYATPYRDGSGAFHPRKAELHFGAYLAWCNRPL